MKKKVALVGVGGIAQAHLQGWASQPEAEVVLLCDVNRDIAEARREKYGLSGARVVTDFAEVLSSEVDLLDLCTPSALHAEQSIAALEAGRHVMCEKPMANSLAEAEAIAQAAAAAPDVVYLCEHRYLFDPLVQAAMACRAELGTPFWFRQRSAHALSVSPSIRAVGAFLDIGYHPLYTALHFLGPARTVFAQCRSLVRPEMANDNGLYVLEHDGGTSLVEGSFSSIGPMGGNRPFELYGSQATLIGNWAPQMQLTLYPGEQGGEIGTPQPVTIPAGSWNANAVRHFLDVVDGKATPLSGAAEALQTMRTYAAALRSAESGSKEAVAS